MKHFRDKGLVLSTGKVIDANCDIVGISPDGEIFGGYDDAYIATKLTTSERVELADYMLAKWQEYKEANK